MLNIILEGGLVQAVETDEPNLVGLVLNVIDLDAEGADDDDITPMTDGTNTMNAVIGIAVVRDITIREKKA